MIVRRGAIDYWPKSYRDEAYDAAPELITALEAAVHVARRLGISDTWPAVGESDSAEMLPRLAEAIRGVTGLRLCNPESNRASYGGGSIYGFTGAVRALLHAHAWLGVWGEQKHYDFDQLVIYPPIHEPGCTSDHSYTAGVAVLPHRSDPLGFDRPDDLRHWLAEHKPAAA